MFDFLNTNELRAFISDQSQVLDRHTKDDPEAAVQDWAVAMVTAIHNAKIELSRRQRFSRAHRRVTEVSAAGRRQSRFPSGIDFAEPGREPRLAERA